MTYRQTHRIIFLFRRHFRLKGYKGAFLVIIVPLIFICLLIFYSKPVVTKTVGWEKKYPVLSHNNDIINYDVASAGNYVVIVYEKKSADSSVIGAAVSFDRGESFLPGIRIAEADTIIEAKPVAALNPEGRISAVWQQFEGETASTSLYLSFSDDLGAAWSTPEQIFPDSVDNIRMKMLPGIFYDDRGRLHLFFHGLTDEDINLYHAESGEEGFDRVQPLIRLPEQMRGAFFPVIANSGSKIVIIWQSKIEGLRDSLFSISSSNYGRRWSRIREISPDEFGSSSPVIILHGGKSYLVYRNNRGGRWTVNLLIGDADAENWSEQPVTVSETRMDTYMPRATVFEDDLIITWYEQHDGAPHIFSRKFSLTEERLFPPVKISGINASRNPEPVHFDDRVIIFWQESRRILARKTDTQAVPPVVFSRTHLEGRWSRLSEAVIEWDQPHDESGIIGYAIMYNTIPDYKPEIQVIQGGASRYIVPDVTDGVSYFHIRSIDGAGNMSRTVHHKIKSSSTPLPMPAVVSPSHPQGEPVESGNPVFRWTVDNIDRLKGFYIGISKDRIISPRDFTTDFETTLENLEPGNYYLSLRAVDMTNRPGQTSIYHFVVGKDIEPDDDEYVSRIVRGYAEKDDLPVPVRAPVRPDPEVVLDIKEASENIIKSRAFKAAVSVKNVRRSDISGYSVVVDRNRLEPLKRINYKNSEMKFDNLESGYYYISIRARYSRDGAEHWTASKHYKIKVEIESFDNQLSGVGYVVADRISSNPLFVVLSLSVFGAFIVFNSFSSRIMYYFKYAFHRILKSCRFKISGRDV